jgi:hypothetical protein
MAAVPVISPNLHAESDALGHLTDLERIAVANGFNYQLSCEDTLTEALDVRDPDNPKNLDGFLIVDQLAFLRTLPTRRSIAIQQLRVERVECEYMEVNEWFRFRTFFHVRWTVHLSGEKEPRVIEAFSYGTEKQQGLFDSRDPKDLWLKGAAGAYQAVTYKLAVALQKLLEEEHRK